MTDTNEPGEQFDGTVDDVVIPDDVREASEARIAAAVAKYGNAQAPAE
jgi:hypothetical protein